MQSKVIIAGGGTGGHVYPALAVADELKSRGVDVSFVGSRRGLEASVVPEAGYENTWPQHANSRRHNVRPRPPR